MGEPRRLDLGPSTAAASLRELSADEGVLVPLFAALADPTRLGILVDLALAGEARDVNAVAALAGVDTSVASRHLKILREVGAVAGERDGRRVLHHVEYRDLSALLRRVADAIDVCCPPDVDA